MAAQPKIRPLTVSYVKNQSNKTVPLLRLQGDWFQQAGFNPGDQVKVEVSAGKLIITKHTDYSEKNRKLQQRIQQLKHQIADLEQTFVK